MLAYDHFLDGILAFCYRLRRSQRIQSRRTIEMIAARLEKESNREGIITVIDKLNTIEEKLRGSNYIAKKKDVIGLQKQLSLLDAKVTAHEENVVKKTDITDIQKRLQKVEGDGLVKLGERLTSLKERIQTHDQATGKVEYLTRATPPSRFICRVEAAVYN